MLPNCCAVANSTKIWLSNAAAISDAVLPRAIERYTDAEELVRFQKAQEQECEAEEESKTDEPQTDEADDAHHNVLKRNEYFAVDASIVSKECADLQAEAINGGFDQDLHGSEAEGLHRTIFRGLKRIRYRIHCIAALSSHRAAQDGYLEATSLDDLKGMRDDSAGTKPRHYYIDFDYFRVHIKTSWARNAFDSIEGVYRDECCRKYLN